MVLRGLTVEGASVANFGLWVTSAAKLDVTDCTFRNFANDGLHVEARQGNLIFNLAKVVATDNGLSGMFLTGAAKVAGKIVDSSFNRNGINGFYALNWQATNAADAITQIAFVGGEAHLNAYGYRVGSTVANNPVLLTLEDVTASSNTIAGVSSSGAVREARLAKSVIAHNGVGAEGVSLTTSKSTVFADNTTDLTATLAAASAF